MRKSVFGLLLVFSFVLSGCEFIPEEYRDQLGDLVDNYCEENPEEEVCDLDLTTTELEVYFDDYNNHELTNEDLGMKYFDGELPSEIAVERDQHIADGVTLRLDDVQIELDGTFVVTYAEVTATSEKCCTKRPGRINYRESDITIEWGEPIDEDCDNIDDDCDLVTDDSQAQTFFEEFFMKFVDPTISNEEFTSMYFEGEMPVDFLNERNSVLESEGTFEEVMLSLRDDGTYEVTYTFRIGNDRVVRKRPGRIRQRPDLLLSEWDALIDETIE